MAEVLNHERRSLLTLAASTIVASRLGVIAAKNSKLTSESDLPYLRGATAWLNSEPLTRADLRGKVVLVDFWTYSCINWRRTLPYLRGWAKKYRDYGLVLVGVHTPEFTFEKNIDNVCEATKVMRIDYPVAMDNDYAIWRAFNNEYWPALYFLDANSKIRAQRFGEGGYDESERTIQQIQQMLSRIGATGFDRENLSGEATGAEVAADWSDLKSGENYLGYERTQNFASPGGLKSGKCNKYALPVQLKLNHWALSGNWTAQKEGIVSAEEHVSIAYQFHARDIHLVMAPATRGATVRFRLLERFAIKQT